MVNCWCDKNKEIEWKWIVEWVVGNMNCLRINALTKKVYGAMLKVYLQRDKKKIINMCKHKA